MYWIDAASKESLELSFLGIADDPAAKWAGVEGSIESILKWFPRLSKEWLLILDNADGDPDLIDAFIPSGGRANILISSRNPSLRHRIPTSGVMEVGEMSMNEAKCLIAKIAHLDDNTAVDMNEQLASIAHELRSIPLALDHAGSAILSELCDLSGYLSMLRTHRKTLLANSRFHGAPGYNQTLYSTWSLTTSLLERRARTPTTETTPESAAIELLNMLAFFHHNSIMEEIFRRAAECKNKPNDSYESCGLPMSAEHLPRYFLEVFGDSKWDPLNFRQAMQVLRSASLVRRDKGRTSYSIHPLVHVWSRERLPAGELERARLSVQAVLSASIGINTPRHDVQFCRQLIPHLVSFRKVVDDLKLPDAYCDDSTKSFWHVFLDNGLFNEAEPYVMELKDRRSQLIGPKHQYSLNAAEFLAITRRESGIKGKLEKSLALHEETYRLRAEALGEGHADTLKSQVILGSIYHYIGSFQQAKSLLDAAWSKVRTHLGESHPLVSQAALPLSSVYWELGLYDRAEEMQRKLLDIAKANFGDDDLRTLLAMGSLAATLTTRGKLDESEVLKCHIAERRLKVLGEDHPDTLLAQANLAATYCKQNRWEEAEKIIAIVTERRSVVLGMLHRETLRGRLILANCYEGQGRFEEAESQYQQVVEGRASVLGETHAHTLWSRHKLAGILEKLGRLADAIDLWQRTLSMQRVSPDLGEKHWETKATATKLAEAQEKYGKMHQSIATRIA